MNAKDVKRIGQFKLKKFFFKRDQKQINKAEETYDQYNGLTAQDYHDYVKFYAAVTRW